MHAPFYFCYRHIIEQYDLPEVPGLVCEKGSWWYPAGEGPDFNDTEAPGKIWEFWRRERGEKLLALFPTVESLAAYAEEWVPPWLS